MGTRPHRRGRGWDARVAKASVLTCVLLVGAAGHTEAQSAPTAVPRVAVADLEGEWYEIATTRSFWHRRCLSNTRYRFSAPTARGLDAASACTTARGTAAQRGRLRTARSGDGRLSIRFAPALFAWLPATWADFWILAMNDGLDWLLIGDNRRERLSIVSRTVVLDEASMARALAEARQHGYDTSRLTRVPQPAGPSGLVFP